MVFRILSGQPSLVGGDLPSRDTQPLGGGLGGGGGGEALYDPTRPNPSLNPTWRFMG